MHLLQTHQRKSICGSANGQYTTFMNAVTCPECLTIINCAARLDIIAFNTKYLAKVLRGEVQIAKFNFPEAK